MIFPPASAHILSADAAGASSSSRGPLILKMLANHTGPHGFCGIVARAESDDAMKITLISLISPDPDAAPQNASTGMPLDIAFIHFVASGIARKAGSAREVTPDHGLLARRRRRRHGSAIAGEYHLWREMRVGYRGGRSGLNLSRFLKRGQPPWSMEGLDGEQKARLEDEGVEPI